MAAMLAVKLSPHALSRFVVYGALPPTVLLRTVDGVERKPLGESNLTRDRFFLRASSAHSVRRVLDLDAVFDGDHVGGDSRHPLLPGVCRAARTHARARDARSDDGHRRDHDYRDRTRRRAGAVFSGRGGLVASVGAFAPGRRWQATMAGAAVGAALDRLVGYGDVPTGGFQDRLEEFVDSRGTIFVDVYRYTSQRDRSERAAFHG